MENNLKRKPWITAGATAALLGVLTGCAAGGTGDESQATGTGTVTNLTEQTNLGVEVEYDGEPSSYASVTDFGCQLFAQNMEGVTNPVLSPASAYIALSMAAGGSHEATQEEFRNVLGGVFEDYSDFMTNRFPTETDNMTLTLANSAWLDDELTVNENWLAQIKSLYDAEAYSANLSTADAMDSMNQWCSDNTQGLIKQMIDEPMPDETRLVLFNALYFKAKWEMQFDPNHTYEQAFYAEDGSSGDVDMMHENDAYLDYVTCEGADGVLLPYQDSTLAFMALRPADGTTARELAASLDADTISSLLDNRQEDTYMALTLPKFEVSFDAVLNDSLIAMGLATAFDEDNADLSGVGTCAGGGNLYISLVRQKAVVRVDEEGTEAAAVTEVAMAELAALMEELPLDMTFDHPFVYLIVDTETQVPLFIGIMEAPAE